MGYPAHFQRPPAPTVQSDHMTLLDRIAAAIARENLFRHAGRVGVAVSGGADSICLLHALFELRPVGAWRLEILHVNHMLRGDESDGDESYVKALARQLDLPFHSRRVDTLGRGGNLEETARDIRRGLFREWMHSIPLDCVALAHTRSDQAETVLFRFLRGSYLTGLAGMRPKTADGLVRPMLDIGRAEVEAWLRERGIGWREDRTNRDPAFARNRIRHQLLPALAAEWNPGLPGILARHATLAREDEDYWSGRLDSIEPEFTSVWNHDRILSVQEPFRGLPPALARRLVRRQIERVKGGLRGVDARHVGAVFDLCRGPSGHYRVQVPGVDVLRSFDHVRFTAPPSSGPAPGYNIPAQPPAAVALPFARCLVHLEIVDRSGKVTEHDTLEAELDWNRVQSDMSVVGGSKPGLFLRNWRPGDAYRRAGDRQEQKLKALFHTARIPLWERRHWPILSNGERIVWARAFGPAEDFAANPGTQIVLRISERFHESTGVVSTSV